MIEINNKITIQEEINIVDVVIPNTRFNSVDTKVVNDLKKSINSRGLFQSIMVLKLLDGTYQLIGGYHRYIATKELGHTTIQAKIFTDLSNDEVKIMELEENIVRNQFDNFVLGRLIVELEKYYLKNTPIVTENKKGKPKGNNDKIVNATGVNLRQVQRSKELIKILEEDKEVMKHLETKQSALQNSDMKKIAVFPKKYRDKFIEQTKDELTKETTKKVVKELTLEIKLEEEETRKENINKILKNICYRGNSKDILQKIPANYFNHCITDIPYGIGVKKEMGKGKTNCKSEEWDLSIPDILLFEEIYRTIKPGGFFVTTFTPRLDINLQLLDKLTKVGFDTSFNQMYWIHESNMNRAYQMDKRIREKQESGVYQNVDSSKFKGERTPGVAPMVEPIIIVQKPFESSIEENAVSSTLDGKTSKGTFNYEETMVKGRQPQQMISLDEINKLIGEKFSIKDWSEKFIGDFLYASKPNKEKHLDYQGNTIELESKKSDDKQNDHASVKPVALFAYLLKLFTTDKNSIILEPFSGSGTTLLASKLLGINYFGIEMDEDYYEIIKKRLKQNDTYTVEMLNFS